MAFLPDRNNDGHQMPWEHLEAAAGSYQIGQLLNVGTDGKLAALTAAATTTPPYVSMHEGTVEAGALLPVVRVNGHGMFETTWSEKATGAVVGSKCQVSADGTQAKFVSASPGTFEVVEMEGVEAGDRVRGRFVPIYVVTVTEEGT